MVIWRERPPGQRFTEGRPSGVSFAMVEVQDGLDPATPEAVMLALASECARVAGVGTECRAAPLRLVGQPAAKRPR